MATARERHLVNGRSEYKRSVIAVAGCMQDIEAAEVDKVQELLAIEFRDRFK
jgi:hypothetical protein